MKKAWSIVLQSGRMLEEHSCSVHLGEVSEHGCSERWSPRGTEQSPAPFWRRVSILAAWRASLASFENVGTFPQEAGYLLIYHVKAKPWMTCRPELPMFYTRKCCETKPKVNILDIISNGDSWKTSTTSPNLDYNYAREQSRKKAFIGSIL